MTNPSKISQRSFWFNLHLWLGWIAALPLIAVCLTGALLVFQEEMIRSEQRLPIPSGSEVKPLSGGEVIKILYAAKLRPNHLQFPPERDQPFQAYVTDISGSAPKQGKVFIDPYSGKITREDERFLWSTYLVRLHRNLCLGKSGQIVVAVSSCVLAVTSLVGFFLWWPLRRRGLLRSLKKGKARDWHNLIGVVSLLPLFVMALTGITFTWGKHIFPVTEQIAGRPLNSSPPAVVVPEEGNKKTSGEALEKARLEHPGWSVTGLQPSSAPSIPQTIIFGNEGNRVLTVWYNPYTLEKMGQSDDSEGGPFGWYQRNFGELHTLHYLPVFIRGAWGIFSLCGVILALTGLWMSLRRWKALKT